MKRLFACLLVSFFIIGSPVTYSKDEENSAEDQFKKIAANGPGVYLIQKDKKGRITSCVVVGQSRISTALGAAKGLELARGKADLSCSSEFVKWLKAEIKVYQVNDEESVILLDGKEVAGENELKEIGKSVEKSSTKMESVSKGLVRGLQNMHKTVDGEGKLYTVLKGFKADNANAAKKLSKDLASDEPEVKSKSGAKPDNDKKGKPANEIKSESVTAPGAEDFLPKKK